MPVNKFDAWQIVLGPRAAVGNIDAAISHLETGHFQSIAAAPPPILGVNRLPGPPAPRGRAQNAGHA